VIAVLWKGENKIKSQEIILGRNEKSKVKEKNDTEYFISIYPKVVIMERILYYIQIS